MVQMQKQLRWNKHIKKCDLVYVYAQAINNMPSIAITSAEAYKRLYCMYLPSVMSFFLSVPTTPSANGGSKPMCIAEWL